MTEPIVFISHFKVKEGELESLEQLNQEVADYIQANRPGTAAFLLFFNEEKTELSIVHMFPDADSFDNHVIGTDERVQKAAEFIIPTRREVYGTPSEQVMRMLIPPEGSGIDFQVMPHHASGYIRSQPG